MIYSSISPLVSISKVGHFQNYDTDGQANEDDGGISELNSLPSETSVLRFGEENFGVNPEERTLIMPVCLNDLPLLYLQIWSLRFSGDNREIVAGTSAATIVVYDIESRSVLHTIDGHNDDVNAVAFADTSNSHVLFSGSDDSLVKIWDRRSLGRNCKPSGTLVGHTEGITFIESKGDGRYCLSNSKDQSAKLWDIRRMLNEQQADESCKISYQRNWDYR